MYVYRLVFWTDWGSTPSVQQASIDGSNKRVIIQGELKWPNALVIDEPSQKLFWADAGLDKIETSDLEVKPVANHSDEGLKERLIFYDG